MNPSASMLSVLF